MKAIIFSTLFVLSFLFSNEQKQTDVNAIKFNELIKNGNGVIVDVRTPHEFSRGHIANATLIDISNKQFANKINLLQKDKPVYIYCLTGSRSRNAASFMMKNGFMEVYNLQNGIIDWQRNGFPTELSESPVASNSKSFSVSTFNELIKSNKLILIDFHAPWCAPCKTMNPIIDKLANDYKGKLAVEKIDIETNREIAEANQIQSIPGFILFKNGRNVWTHKGIISYEELSKIIKQQL